MRTTVIVIVVVLLVLIALAVWLVQRQRTARLRQRFGPEYDRTLERTGDRRRTEQTLSRVVERRDALVLRPLQPADREVWAQQWAAVQARFVDAPEEAVARAHDLVPELMQARGYPDGDVDERSVLLATDHPDLAGAYREAEQTWARHREVAAGSDGTPADTEDLRQVLVRYHSIVDTLVQGEHPTHGRHVADGEDLADTGTTSTGTTSTGTTTDTPRPTDTARNGARP